MLPKIPILHRYVFKECAFFVAVALFVFTSVLFTIRLLNFASLVINKGVNASQVGKVFLTIVPTFLELALPLSVLLGIMLGFARLSGDSEIIVLRANGIKQSQLILPVIILSLVASIFGLLISKNLKPWGYRTLNSALLDIARTKTTSGLTQGIFNNLGLLTLYAEKIDDQTGELSKVLIDDRRDPNTRQIITAKHGVLSSDSDRDEIRFTLQNGESHTQQDNKYSVTAFDSNIIIINPTSLYDPDTMHSGIKTRELYQEDLTQIKDELSSINLRIKSGESLEKISLSPLLTKYFYNIPLTEEEIQRRDRKISVESTLRVVIPFSSFVLALIAIPLGIHPPRFQRSWGAGLSSIIAMIVFATYYSLLSMGMALSEKGSTPIVFTLWLPNIIFLSLATFMIYKISREEWISVGDGLAKLLQRLTKRAA